jgi:hypothetical protein
MSNEPGQWHISKTVSVGHIVTTLTVALAGFWYFAGLEKRIDTTAIEVAHQKEAIVRVEEQQRRDQSELTRKLTEIRAEQKQDTKRIEDKLDKLIDRELSK